MFSFCRIGDLRIQFFIRGQYGVLEVIAIDTVFTDKLHAAMGFSVIKQQTISVVAVTAKPADKSIYTFALFRCDFKYHGLISFRGF